LEKLEMKKTLVALATLASVSAFAQSTVEIYGTLDVSQAKVSGQQAGLQNTTPALVGSQSTTGIANTFARQGTGTNNMGFRGKEDLGGGMYAGFNLQTGGLDTSTGSAALAFSRESNLSLGSSSWGELKLGRSVSTVCSIGCSFDYNYIGAGSSAGLTGISAASFRASSRRSDQIEFKSLPVAGTTFYASIVQRGDQNADSTFATSQGAAYTATSSNDGTSTTVSSYKNMTTFGAVYQNGPLKIAAVAESASINNPAYRTGTFVGVEYDFGMFTANIQSVVNPYKAIYTDVAGAPQTNVGKYAWTSFAGTTTGKGTTVALKMPVGATTYGVQYSNNDETNVKATELFAQYALSKRTTLFAYRTQLSGASAISGTYSQSSPITAVTGAAGVTSVGADPSIYAFGIRHTF
jgi:predicted porin